MRSDNLNKLNCMNYHVSDSEGDHWFACNGLRSLYTYSKVSDIDFRELCLKMLDKGEVILKDTRDNDNDTLTLTMI
jgi:hypothetical protein